MLNRVLVLLVLVALLLTIPFVAFGGEGGDDDSARPTLTLVTPIHN